MMYESNVDEKDLIAETCAAKKHDVSLSTDCSRCELVKLTKMREIEEKCSIFDEDSVTTWQCARLKPGQTMCLPCRVQWDKIKAHSPCSESCQSKCKDGKLLLCSVWSNLQYCIPGCNYRDRCDHAYSRQKATLDPVAVCNVVYDNRFKKVFETKIFTGPDCMLAYLQYLLVLEKRLEIEMYDTKHMKPLSAEQQLRFNKARKCGGCFRAYSDEGPKMKVRDHVSQ